MSEKRYTLRRPSAPDYAEIMQRYESCNLFVCNFRNMLDNIHPGCFVSSETTRQSGTVLGVIRDRYGVPAAIKVEYEEDGQYGIDYIPAPSVDFWEPFDTCTPDEEYDNMYEDDSYYADEFDSVSDEEADCE